jgi:hypothetical protein
MAAKQAQAILEAREAAKPPLFDAKKQAIAIQERQFEELQFEWLINRNCVYNIDRKKGFKIELCVALGAASLSA